MRNFRYGRVLGALAAVTIDLASYKNAATHYSGMYGELPGGVFGSSRGGEVAPRLGPQVGGRSLRRRLRWAERQRAVRR